MAVFDEQILAVRAFMARCRDTLPAYREKRVPSTAGALLRDLPVSYAPGGKPFVVLQDDTFTELGHPLSGSSSMVLWSPQAELVRDGVITRVGPDVPEAEGRSLPFGQAVLLGGGAFTDREMADVERAADLGHALEGYMIRSVPRKLWSRVSREAAARGFTLEVLGRVVMSRCRERLAGLQAVEILFVTSSKQAVEELETIALEARGKRLSIGRLSRAGDGAYECEELNCSACKEKPACDTLRQVLVIRKKGKITGVRLVRGPAA